MQEASRPGRVIAWLAAATILLAGTGRAGATTLLRMDLPEIVNRADRVVHARAVDKKVYWDQAGRNIYTDTTFEVLDEAKGRGPKRFTVSFIGGRIDPVEVTVEGTPAFAIGEEVLLFTSARPDGKKNLVGFSQGVMRVSEDAETGEKVAVSETLTGITMVEPGHGAPAASRSERTVAPLGAMLDAIRKMVEEGQPAGPRLSKTPAKLDPGAAQEKNP